MDVEKKYSAVAAAKHNRFPHHNPPSRPKVPDPKEEEVMRHIHLIPRRRRVFVFNGKGGGGDGSMTGQKFIRNWNRKENARTNGMPRHARRIFFQS